MGILIFIKDFFITRLIIKIASFFVNLAIFFKDLKKLSQKVSKFFVIILLLTNCHLAHDISNKNPFIYIVEDIKFNLLRPEEINKNIVLNQYFSANYKNNNYKLTLITEFFPKQINIIGLSEFGNRIFTIKYQNSDINFTANKFNKKIKAEYIIADMLLTYLPLSTIKNNIDRKISVKENITSDGLERIFFYQNKKLIKITYNNFLDKKQKKNLWESDIEYINFERNYQYSIKNLPS